MMAHSNRFVSYTMTAPSNQMSAQVTSKAQTSTANRLTLNTIGTKGMGQEKSKIYRFLNERPPSYVKSRIPSRLSRATHRARCSSLRKSRPVLKSRCRCLWVRVTRLKLTPAPASISVASDASVSFENRSLCCGFFSPVFFYFLPHGNFVLLQ